MLIVEIDHNEVERSERPFDLIISLHYWCFLGNEGICRAVDMQLPYLHQGDYA